MSETLRDARFRGDSSDAEWSDDLDSADVEPEGNEPEGEPGDVPFDEVEFRRNRDESPREWARYGADGYRRDWPR